MSTDAHEPVSIPCVPRSRKVWLALLVAANVVLWAVPSDVVELIARDRHTLLGRYSRTHFYWNIAMAVFLLVNLYTDLAVGAVRRRRQFQVYAVLLLGLPALIGMDALLRGPRHDPYVRDHVAYHRRPNLRFTVEAVDKPVAARTYPDAPPGYGTVACTYTTDRRGFRNRNDLEASDVVALGDSFTEGSRVSDEHVWVDRLEQETGLSVCNLGMSGYDPAAYAAALERFGFELRPRIVLCMLYEGNDFRAVESEAVETSPKVSERVKTYTKQSPLLNAVDRLIVRRFGPMRATRPVQGIELLDWMPLEVPPGGVRYYAFAPKQLRDLLADADAFRRGRHWQAARERLAWMNAACQRRGVRFILIYAPSKAHVVLPAVAHRLPAEKVAGFAAISDVRPPTPPAEFLSYLSSRMDAREEVARRWCEESDVPFISLTQGLRQAAVTGRQVYYTYDQHWTPEGHSVAAEVIGQALVAWREKSPVTPGGA